LLWTSAKKWKKDRALLIDDKKKEPLTTSKAGHKKRVARIQKKGKKHTRLLRPLVEKGEESALGRNIFFEKRGTYWGRGKRHIIQKSQAVVIKRILSIGKKERNQNSSFDL